MKAIGNISFKASLPLLAFGLLLGSVRSLRAQDDSPLLPGEVYRLRVENAQYGGISVSLDGGQSWLLIGRVVRAASEPTPERSASAPGAVVRSGGEGMAFTVGARQVLKLRPAPSTLRSHSHAPSAFAPARCDVLTNLTARSGLFGPLVPPPGARIALEGVDHSLSLIPPGKVLEEGDLFVFLIQEHAPKGAGSSDQQAAEKHLSDRRDLADKEFHSLAQTYASTTLSRAHAAKRPVVSGTLTLKAGLPQGEPDPIEAVTYAIDGVMLAGQNVPPYQFDWDTTSASNGEHVVEISALNHSGRQISHVRALIVVANQPPHPENNK